MEPEDLYEGGRQLMPILTGTNDKLRRALPGETGVLGFYLPLAVSLPLPCGASAVIGQVASRLDLEGGDAY